MKEGAEKVRGREGGNGEDGRREGGSGERRCMIIHVDRFLLT